MATILVATTQFNFDNTALGSDLQTWFGTMTINTVYDVEIDRLGNRQGKLILFYE